MDQDKDTALPGFIDVTEDQIGSAQLLDRERVRLQALGHKGPFRTDPSRCDVWAGNTRDTAAVAQDADSELKAGRGWARSSAATETVRTQVLDLLGDGECGFGKRSRHRPPHWPQKKTRQVCVPFRAEAWRVRLALR